MVFFILYLWCQVRIYKACFGGCTSLESVTFIGPINTVGSYAFSDCSALKALSFIGNTYSVGAGAFKGCDSLKELSFEVTRRSANQKWDKDWKEGCSATVIWKRDLVPLLAGVIAVIVIAFVAVNVWKKRKSAV